MLQEFIFATLEQLIEAMTGLIILNGVIKMKILTNGKRESTYKYGRGHVFFHRLTKERARLYSLCRPEVWRNWIELEMTNEPPQEYMCPACIILDTDQPMATRATQQMIEKISNLAIGEEGVIFILSDRSGVTIASNGIGDESIPMVIEEALKVAKEITP